MDNRDNRRDRLCSPGCFVNEHDNKHNLYNTGKVGIVALVALVVHVVFS